MDYGRKEKVRLDADPTCFSSTSPTLLEFGFSTSRCTSSGRPSDVMTQHVPTFDGAGERDAEGEVVKKSERSALSSDSSRNWRAAAEQSGALTDARLPCSQLLGWIVEGTCILDVL